MFWDALREAAGRRHDKKKIKHPFSLKFVSLQKAEKNWIFLEHKKMER